MIELECEDYEILEKIKSGTFDWNSFKGSQIFHDIEFCLFVDKVHVASYYVIFERINSKATSITSAEVQYENHFITSEDPTLREKYLGKGYIKTGLTAICEYLLKSCNIPYIHADIAKDNLVSQHVASSCGFKNGILYHPNARNLYRNALGNNYPPEIIDKYMNNFDNLYNQVLDENSKKK